MKSPRKNKSFYITTSIAYVNAAPHIGFALELVLEDVLARYKRAKGFDVFSMTGTDEHGVKIYNTAKEQKMETKAFVDQNSLKFRELKELLNLSYDFFIRTTDEFHKKGATKLWDLIVKAGDIYKDKYEGYYCVGCEAFVTKKELIDGLCPIHKKEPQFLSEENYFFRLSKYENELKRLIETDEIKIVPEERKNEILALIDRGLKDVSFSRPKELLPWGVNVPNDEKQVMYVWCDALSNYLTGVGFFDDEEKFNKYWPADIHLIGKDILRFHSAIWPAMLLSAGLPCPKAIYVHGFITSEGQKMSKSLGNVVDPFSFVQKYGVDALRYYLLREIPTVGDGDFSHSRFLSLYNTDLANNLGNLVNRIVAMLDKYFAGKIPDVDVSKEVLGEIAKTIDILDKNIDKFDLKEALAAIFALVEYANKYIDEKKPWQMAKNDPNSVELKQVMKDLGEVLVRIAYLLEFFLPEKAREIQMIFPMDFHTKEFDKTALLDAKIILKKNQPLFPRIEE